MHDTRVAIRRLRSTLRVFGKLLDPSEVGNLDDELRWFAGLLGEVRDCQVQRRRFQNVLADWPPELVLGPVDSRINAELHSVQLQARRRVVDEMNSTRYLDILTTLQRWRSTPPVAKPPTIKALKKRARRAGRKADRRLTAAIRAGDGDLLHRARKAAKRARYAAELVGPVDKPKSAKKTVKHYSRFSGYWANNRPPMRPATGLENSWASVLYPRWRSANRRSQASNPEALPQAHESRRRTHCPSLPAYE